MVRSIDVGVDLRGADIRMAEQLLDHAQVRPTAHHVRREAVAKHVWMDALESCDRCVLAHDLPDGDPFKRSAPT